MTKELHIDLETYSSESLRDVGAYKYVASPDFEIMLIAYCLDQRNIRVVDLTVEEWPQELTDALQDETVEKHAHNATFERLCLREYGYDIPASQWRCSAVKASYCGLPMALDDVSKVLNLGEDAKSKTGQDLIRFFSKPIKPTKANGMRRRNLPHHSPEKWEMFKDYVRQDVVAEMAVNDRLAGYKMPDFEHHMYALDQAINDRGLAVDVKLSEAAILINQLNKAALLNRIGEITNLDNPNSPAQLKGWLSEKLGKTVKSIAKDKMQELLDGVQADEVVEVLNLRSMSSKTSVKKYTTLIASLGYDKRSRGHLQFYGAGRTGRWAGRLVQVHNLPRNYLKDLDGARADIKTKTFAELQEQYDNIADTLSQLIRTAIISGPGHSFSVADFSAIEARIAAWLAGESWRQEVFATHGKIYEASAAMMFNLELDSVTPEQRQQGKVAELALAYGGSVGAMEKMDYSKAIPYDQYKTIVSKWRKASPAITDFWKELNTCAIRTIETGKKVKTKNGLFTFGMTRDRALIIQLPSGRWLVYRDAKIGENRFGSKSVMYKSLDQKTKTWVSEDTYGGKLFENICQAVARDVIAETIVRMGEENIPCVLHVHDEVVAETPDDEAEEVLERLCEIMAEPIDWAQGLILTGEGFVSKYYKK